ncbi:NUDIX domain-containing protein [Salinispora mooreana]|uniref:NUDIX domain-containing protein n=1 Tax=Salinispora mooreana TaxID=999545 RepID=UPI0003804CCB|nr:NUDIX domain-containing protein [Salinispora mooreana]
MTTVAPAPPTGIRYGRGHLGHWGERLYADALVTAHTDDGVRWLLMIDHAGDHGWALPGGPVDLGEDPQDAAFRQLYAASGLHLDDMQWRTLSPRYVPDLRAGGEAWMVTVPSCVHVGTYAAARRMPEVVGQDDTRAMWVLAHTYQALVAHLDTVYGGTVCIAHRDLLADVLDGAA